MVLVRLFIASAWWSNRLSPPSHFPIAKPSGLLFFLDYTFYVIAIGLVYRIALLSLCLFSFLVLQVILALASPFHDTLCALLPFCTFYPPSYSLPSYDIVLHRIAILYSVHYYPLISYILPFLHSFNLSFSSRTHTFTCVCRRHTIFMTSILSCIIYRTILFLPFRYSNILPYPIDIGIGICSPSPLHYPSFLCTS